MNVAFNAAVIKLRLVGSCDGGQPSASAITVPGTEPDSPMSDSTARGRTAVIYRKTKLQCESNTDTDTVPLVMHEPF